jgi:hypothetical protein
MVAISSTIGGPALAAPADGPRPFASPGDVIEFAVVGAHVFVVSDTAGDGDYKLWEYAEDGTGGAVPGSPIGETSIVALGDKLLLPSDLETFDIATGTFEPWVGVTNVLGPGAASVADGVAQFASTLIGGGGGGWSSTDGVNFTPSDPFVDTEQVTLGSTQYAIDQDATATSFTVVRDVAGTRTPLVGAPSDPSDLAVAGDQLFIGTTSGQLYHYAAGDVAPVLVPGVPAIQRLESVGDAVIVSYAVGGGAASALIAPDLTVTPVADDHLFDVDTPATLNGVVYMTASTAPRGLWAYSAGSFTPVLPPSGTLDGAFSVVRASSDAVYFTALSDVRARYSLFVYRPSTDPAAAAPGAPGGTAAPALARTGVDMLPGALAAILLAAAGIALLLRTRLRRPRS